MDLQETLNNRLDSLFNELLQTIADHFNIDFNELSKFMDGLDLKTGQYTVSLTCMHTMISGKNKGKLCPAKALNNGYCGRHQNSASVTMGSLIKGGQKQEKGMTKTQIQIIEWLNTAVPQDETVLKKRSKGLLHEDTEIIFDEDYTVIGRLNNDKIVKLSNFEVEMCEKRGWQYKQDMIELSEED